MSETAVTIIPCGLCGNPTRWLGTKRCDRCWELETRIENDPELAKRILVALAPQPEPDAGEEWRVEARGLSAKVYVCDEDRIVATASDEESAAQIVSDHVAVALASKLVAALDNARRCLERPDRSQLSVRRAIQKADEALALVKGRQQ